MATKNEAWVDEWQSMSFCFCCHHFFSEWLTATLLFDDHYASQPAKHREDNGKCLQDLKKFIPSYFTVFVMRGISCFCLSFPCFLGFYQQANPPLWKCFTAWISQKQPPDAGSCSIAIPLFGTHRDWSAGCFCELDLHMRDEGAALYYILQVSWKIFNPTINWANLLRLCPLFLNWKWWLMLFWLMVNVSLGLAHSSCPMASVAPQMENVNYVDSTSFPCHFLRYNTLSR